jgi:uncharacterized protein
MESDLTNEKQLIQIEVIYALPNEQKLYSLCVNPDTNVEQAIQLSGILKDYPMIDLSQTKVGIFSKVCSLTDGLHDFDRIEIYRPLVADPKEARKKRAGTPN